MILKLSIPAQDTDYGPVSTQTLFLPIIAALLDNSGDTRYYVNLPNLPPEDAIAVPGTMEAHYSVNKSRLFVTWDQNSVGDVYATGLGIVTDTASIVEDFPRLP